MTGYKAQTGAATLQRKWPSHRAGHIQLYSQPSPNGLKVSMMLEECGLPYEAHRIEFGETGTRSREYLAVNPNGKIPLILDPQGPGGRPFVLAESNAILLYLADKTGLFLESKGSARYAAISWLFWQASALGPTLGQIGYFHVFAGREIQDRRPLEFHVAEGRRLLALLDAQLSDRKWMMGDKFGIVDISLLGWIRNLLGSYDAGNLVDFAGFVSLARWLKAGLQRPAVDRALSLPAPI